MRRTLWCEGLGHVDHMSERGMGSLCKEGHPQWKIANFEPAAASPSRTTSSTSAFFEEPIV